MLTLVRQQIQKHLPAGSLSRNVSILTGGTVFAQLITVLALPILTRLYRPEDFALLAVYAAVLGIITTVSCLRYNLAIPMPMQDRDGFALLIVSVSSAVGISFLLALPVFFIPEMSAHLLGQPALLPYLWMIPTGVLIYSIYNALQYWSSRKRRFTLITKTRMTRATGSIATQIGLGLGTTSPFGLIFGHLVYGGLGIWGLAREIFRSDQSCFGELTTAQMWQQAKAYRRFPIFSVPEALFNTAGIQLPIIVVAAAVAGPEAGFVMLAMRVLGLPMNLVGTSVAQTYLAEAPEWHRDGELAARTKRAMWALLKLGGPVIALAGISSPFLFPIVFGAQWERAGIIAAWMTPWFVLQFVTSPISVVLHVTGQFGFAMILHLSGAIVRVGAVLVIVVLAEDFAAETYALSGAVFYLVYLIAIISRIKILDSN